MKLSSTPHEQVMRLSGIVIRVPQSMAARLLPEWQTKDRLTWQDPDGRFYLTVCEDYFYQPVEAETAYFLNTFGFEPLCAERNVARAGFHGRRIYFRDDDGADTLQEFFSYGRDLSGVNGFVITLRMAPGRPYFEALEDTEMQTLLQSIRPVLSKEVQSRA